MPFQMVGRPSTPVGTLCKLTFGAYVAITLHDARLFEVIHPNDPISLGFDGKGPVPSQYHPRLHTFNLYDLHVSYKSVLWSHEGLKENLLKAERWCQSK